MAATSAQGDAPELDEGPRAAARETERLCVATRAVKPVSSMIRFVPAPDGAVVPDLKRRLPGRGAWVTARRDALALAVKRNAFARSLKRPVRAGPDLVAQTEALLWQAALDMLAMANKAGLLVTGFTKVEAALLAKPLAALIQAAEAAPDGVRKIAALRRRRGAEPAGDLPVLVFAEAHLSLALGRPHVIHAALLAGPASEAAVARYRAFRAFGEAGSDDGQPVRRGTERADLGGLPDED